MSLLRRAREDGNSPKGQAPSAAGDLTRIGETDESADQRSDVEDSDNKKLNVNLTGNDVDNAEHDVSTPVEDENETCPLWGGKMVDSIHECKGSISLFSDQCLGVHGLYDAFYSRNGIMRTLTYLFVWIAFGFLFFYLTIPLVRDYQARVVTTSFDNGYPSSDTIGLPLPIITVCPYGSGIHCQCLLWRKLHCRYKNDVPNEDWMVRFDKYACVSEFDESDLSRPPVWLEPRCEDFEIDDISLEDPCGKVVLAGIEEQYTADILFERLVDRESESDGPYLTYQELIMYGSLNMRENIHVFRETGLMDYRGPSLVPESWIISNYVEWSRFQVCIHIRPPPEILQTISGSSEGISVFITGVTDTYYSFYDSGKAAAAVDINVNVIHPDLYNSTFLPVEAHQYYSSRAGSIFDFKYSSTLFKREQGWGPAASKVCKDTAVPRGLCTENYIARVASEKCGCASDLEFSPLSSHIPPIFQCSSSPGTEQYFCLIDSLREISPARIPFDVCPPQCEVYGYEVVSIGATSVSDAQMRALRRAVYRMEIELDDDVSKDSVIIFRAGLGSLLRTITKEEPKVSFGALMGQIGGNAGLWCGLSFVLMVEVLEFGIVAILYGSGFYKGQYRKSLGDRLRSIFNK